MLVLGLKFANFNFSIFFGSDKIDDIHTGTCAAKISSSLRFIKIEEQDAVKEKKP